MNDEKAKYINGYQDAVQAAVVLLPSTPENRAVLAKLSEFADSLPYRVFPFPALEDLEEVEE